MDEHTALDIGRKWLLKVRASDERLRVLADTLQRIAAQPEAHAWATDGRLALLAKKELWIATLSLETDDDVTTVKIERVDLGDQRIRLSLAQAHSMAFDRPLITYTWRFELDRSDELEFESKEDYLYGRKSDDPTLAFGWRLADVTGWSKPG